MSSGRRFILNGVVLALSGIIFRTVAVSFNAYISARIGAEGMGLYSLVMSVYGLAVTFAASGVNLAAVRLSAELDDTDSSKMRAVMRRVFLYGALFGFASMFVLFVSAGVIGRGLLADERCVISLRAMAFSMPLISVSAAMAGYFSGVGRAYKNALIGAIEQAWRIVFVIAGIVVFAGKGIKWACFALVCGQTAAEVVSAIFAYAFYTFDRRKRFERKACGSVSSGRGAGAGASAFSRVVSIALPVALGSYVRQGFTTAEHIAIPWGLKKNGSGSTSALECYGVLQGMALPLVLYPSAVIAAFTGLLVPELARISDGKHPELIKRTAESAVKISLVFSVGAAGVFSLYGYELGRSIYSSGEAGRYVRMLAPLVPMMFLDTTVDSILKGLDQQIYTMKVNIIDSIVSLICVLFLVPRMGIVGYIAVIYMSEAVNAALSIERMLRVTGVKLRVSMFAVPGVFVALSYSAVRVLDKISAFELGIRVPLPLTITLFAAGYVAMSLVWYYVGKHNAKRRFRGIRPIRAHARHRR